MLAMQEQPLDVVETATEAGSELKKPKPRQRNLFKNFKSRTFKPAPKEQNADPVNEDDDPLAAFSRSAEVMRRLQEEQEREKERKEMERAAREEQEAAKGAKKQEGAVELEMWEESKRKRRKVSVEADTDADGIEAGEAGSLGRKRSSEVGLMTPPRSRSVASPATPRSSGRKRHAILSPGERRKAQTTSQSPPRFSTKDQPIALSDSEDEANLQSQPASHHTRTSQPQPTIAHSLSPSASTAEQVSARPSATPTPIPSAPPARSAPNPVLSLLIHSPIPSTNPLLVKTRLNKRIKEVRLAWIDKQIQNNLASTNSNPATTPHTHEITHDNIILTWRNRPLFDFTTPKSLGVIVDELTGEAIMAQTAGMSAAEVRAFKEQGVQLVLEALTREGLEARREGRDIYGTSERSADGDGRGGDAEIDGAMPQRHPELPSFGDTQTPDLDPEPVPEAKVRIILRSASSSSYPDYKAAAKSSTSISKIVSAFRKKYDVPAEKLVFLMFEGEKLGEEMSVGETDIEDGDVVEVWVK